MSQSSSSLNSNNPFRRNPPGAPTPQSSLDLHAPSDEAYSSGGLAVANASLPAMTGPPPSGDRFRSQLQALAQSNQPAPVTTFQKPKVVKKVRVQSPPPSSPESAGIPDHYAPAGRGEEPEEDDDESSSTNEDDNDEIRDPFDNIPLRTRLGGEDYFARSEAVPSQKTPPNPFQKTLQDLEGGTRVVENNDSIVAVPLGGKGTLNVDAFRRLLLTGQSGGPSSFVEASIPATEPSSTQHTMQPVPLASDGASMADTSSTSRQSLFDTQDTPRTSHEISEAEPEADQRSLTSKPHAKRPPPIVAARRHGKLINVELKARGMPMVEDTTRPSSSSARSVRETTVVILSPSSPTQQQPLTPSDVNKPLPPAPLELHQGEETESIFDREAAGKVPELDTYPDDSPLPLPRPPTPPNISHVTSSPAPMTSHPPTKPAPPPRRQLHGRSDSKLSITGVLSATSSQPEEKEASPRRSSQDSIRSRSSSHRVGVHAPAPPPPRRSVHAPPRPSIAFVSPSSVSFSSVTSTISERSPSDTAESSPLPTQQLTPSDEITRSMSIASGLVATPGSSASHVADHVVPSLGHHFNYSHSKLSPPPPPPARHTSVRTKRPPSVSSLDGISRRVAVPGHSSMGPPPPPPPPSRQRCSSKGSIDSAITVLPRRTSGDSVRVLPGALAEEPGPTGSETGREDLGEEGAATSANDILANLTALQREVDALRGRYEKEKGV